MYYVLLVHSHSPLSPKSHSGRSSDSLLDDKIERTRPHPLPLSSDGTGVSLLEAVLEILTQDVF